MLAVYMCLTMLWFHVLSALPGARGGLRSLVETLPGDHSSGSFDPRPPRGRVHQHT